MLEIKANSIASTKIVYMLAALPIIDVIIGQIHGLLAPRIGPLSLAQVYHGAILDEWELVVQLLKSWVHPVKY